MTTNKQPELIPSRERELYTTNSIETLNSRLRRAVRARGYFPKDEAAARLLFLVLNRTKKMENSAS